MLQSHLNRNQLFLRKNLFRFFFVTSGHENNGAGAGKDPEGERLTSVRLEATHKGRRTQKNENKFDSY